MEKRRIRENTLKPSFFGDVTVSYKLLGSEDKFKLKILTFAQIIISGLDFLGVILLGGLGALAVQGLESKTPGNKVRVLLEILKINHLNFQNQIAVLGLVAALCFLTKTTLSIYFMRQTLKFLSEKNSEYSNELLCKVLNLDITELQKYTTQQIIFATSEGTRSLTVGILGTSSNIIADFSLLVVMAIGLFILDPTTAAIGFLVMGIASYILFKFQQKKAVILGTVTEKLVVEINENIAETISAYRELTVNSRKKYFLNKINSLREKLMVSFTQISFMPYESKYVIESTMLMSVLLLAGFVFMTKSAVYAVSTLTVFLAAFTRIAPAALRLQQGYIAIRHHSGVSKSYINIRNQVQHVAKLDNSNKWADFQYVGFDPMINIDKLVFTYSPNGNFKLSIDKLDIKTGERIALVGSSGSGKTTLVDLILGLLKPDMGSIKISNQSVSEVIKKWPGAISYVPQEITLINASIEENIAFGYSRNEMDYRQIEFCLKAAKLETYVNSTQFGKDQKLSGTLTNLSGGQKQRIGIARGLYTNPKILVLDEVTSALDAITENEIKESISGLSGQITTIIIAHRLSTVVDADRVIYLDKGKIIASGSFEEVRAQVPDFDKQSKLLGI